MNCSTSLSLNRDENNRLALGSASPSILSTKSSVPKIRSSVRTSCPHRRRLCTADQPPKWGIRGHPIIPLSREKYFLVITLGQKTGNILATPILQVHSWTSP
jgi:hypothetical protein